MEPKEHEHTKYDSGALRSDRKGKGRFDLISPHGLLRLAIQYEEGGRAHAPDERNWELGFPISRALCSAIGHIVDHLKGDRSEDHLAATAWQMFAVMHFEELIKLDLLPKELDDILQAPGNVLLTEPIQQAASFSEFQKAVGIWAEEQYNQMPNAAICKHLREEVDELADDFSPVEAADCLLILLHFAYKNGFDLLAEAQKKQVINLNREWATAPDAKGIYHHIKVPELPIPGPAIAVAQTDIPAGAQIEVSLELHQLLLSGKAAEYGVVVKQGDKFILQIKEVPSDS